MLVSFPFQTYECPHVGIYDDKLSSTKVAWRHDAYAKFDENPSINLKIIGRQTRRHNAISLPFLINKKLNATFTQIGGVCEQSAEENIWI
jgi:hypothetical protein